MSSFYAKLSTKQTFQLPTPGSVWKFKDAYVGKYCPYGAMTANDVIILMEPTNEKGTYDNKLSGICNWKVSTKYGTQIWHDIWTLIDAGHLVSASGIVVESKPDNETEKKKDFLADGVDKLISKYSDSVSTKGFLAGHLVSASNETEKKKGFLADIVDKLTGKEELIGKVLISKKE